MPQSSAKDRIAVLGQGYMGLPPALAQPQAATYDAIIVAVGHRPFVEPGAKAVRALGKLDAGFMTSRVFLANQAVT